MNTLCRVLLVVLRIAIGWHFLYEGVFKLDSDKGLAIYSAGRYPIQAATARLRDDYAKSPDPARIDAWNDELVRIFKSRQPLSEEQKAKLNQFADKLKLLPAEEVAKLDWQYVHEELLKIAPEPDDGRFTSLGYLQSSAGPLRPMFRGLLHDVDGLERLTAASAQARIDERTQQILAHFRDAGTPFSPEQQQKLLAVRDAQKAAIVETINSPEFQARLVDYRAMRDRVHSDSSRVQAPFTRERVDADRKKLDGMAEDMLAFVNEPLSELALQMQSIATPAQLAAGPLRHTPSPADWIDKTIQFSLIAIGICLLLGLFTPVAAVAAAGQLALFYFASPPWPGLPATSMAGHYLYVDRNFIEAVAALVVAATATGQWAGLDYYIARLRARIPVPVYVTRSLS